MKRITVLLGFLVLLGLQVVFAQTKQITGTVTSAEDGMGIPGVSVVVKGTTIGTTTDIDGKYSLNVPQDAATIIFTFVGLKTVEMPTTQSVINVVMESDSQELEEVVVTALGISREKKAIGYAATSVGGDDIVASKAVNPMSALQGKVAGVDISSAPGPGATQNVIIRGASSFGNNQPLYIIDGVPITNSQNRAGDNLNSQVDFGSGINALNPDDIKEMTVLKGAAATALYGSRAANGVIMITTKSGKNTDGKVQVSYDGGFTLTRVGRLADEQKQFGQGWSGDHALDENGNWGPAYDGEDRLWGNIVDMGQQIKPFSYLDNRIRDFFDYGQSYKNAISLSGGTEKTNYFASFSQNSIDGVIPTDQDSYKRYTIATRGSHKAKKLTISSSLNFSTEKNKAVASGQGTSMFRSLYEIPNDISIVDLKDYKSKFNNLDNYFTPYGVNPYYVLNENGAEQNKNKFFGKLQFDYDVLDNLKLTYRFGGDYETSVAQTHEAVIAFSPGAFNSGSSTANPGSYEEQRRERIQLNHDFLLNYNTKFTDNLTLNAVLGVNMNERQYSHLVGAVTSIDIPGQYNLTNSLSPAISSQYREKRRLVGAFGNFDFGFSNYAFLTLTARNDWSSTLPKDKNSFFYPGATFSLLIDELLDKSGIDLGPVSFAKVRAAYGMTGNDADPYFIYDRYVAAASGNPGFPGVNNLTFPLANVNSYSVSNRLGNSGLEPELTTELEFGAEMKFFNNRFGFDVSYYNRLTKGLIEVLPKDPSSGFTTQIGNLGDIRNKGIELVVDVTPVKTNDFSWDISWNFAKNINKVEKLDVPEVFLGGFGGGGIYAVEGKALGQFRFQRIKEVDINGETFIVVDGKGMPQPTADPEYIGKDANEKYRMGLTNTFTYKGISLYGTFDFRYGGYIYSNTKDYMHWTGSSPESVLNDRNPFIVPNSVVQNADGTYSENNVPVDPTALHTFYSTGGMVGEEYAVIDRSYLKLRNVGISYDLPKSLCTRLGVGGIRVSASANNILLWTPAENPYIDPETTTFGNDVSAKFGEFGANPTNEYYTLGLTLNF